MKADMRHTRNQSPRLPRVWFAVVLAVVLVGLVGCKSNKEAKGMGVARGKDPLLAKPENMIPKQNMPIPDRATGPRGRPDPLTTPTGGDKASYNADPERFKGIYLPGERSTPAALAGRLKDSEELKIDDGGGVTLTPVGGTLAGETDPPVEVAQLYADLDRRGIKREDRSLVRENGKWVFYASVIRTSEGAKTQYTGTGDTAAEAVKQVLKQLD